MDRTTMRAELIRDEGLRLHCYRDSVGLYTIGVGHLLGTVPRIMDVTNEEAMALLDMDISIAEATVVRLVNVNWHSTDEPVRWRALVNMAFNLGNRLGDFHHFIAAVNVGDWKKAGLEMADSKWAKQVGARAIRLRSMIETGVA